MIETDRNPVLLHGFTGSGLSWGDEIVDGLAAARLPPVLVDLPGHGRYVGEWDPARFSLEATLDLVFEAGAWPTDLVGYSMGARIALHFAVRHPDRVRRLVLESGSPGLATEREREERRMSDAALARRILDEGIDSFAEYWSTLPIFESQRSLDPDRRRRVHELRAANDPRSLAASLEAVGTGRLPSLWSRLQSVETPTLWLAGARDPKFLAIAERAAEVMPDARAVVVAGAGHTVHLERPDAWLAAVTGFLLEG